MTDKRYESQIDRSMRALDDWRRDRLTYRSRRTSLAEAVTGTYWMFRMGPCHSWAFGKAFSLGAGPRWRNKHPLLRRYFEFMQLICKVIHSRRDYYWDLDLDLLVWGPEGSWPRKAWNQRMRGRELSALAKHVLGLIGNRD